MREWCSGNIATDLLIEYPSKSRGDSHRLRVSCARPRLLSAESPASRGRSGSATRDRGHAAGCYPPGVRSVRFVTFGCKANQYDTQVLREALVRRGLDERDGEVDLVVVNTCTVTEEAARK